LWRLKVIKKTTHEVALFMFYAICLF